MLNFETILLLLAGLRNGASRVKDIAQKHRIITKFEREKIYLVYILINLNLVVKGFISRKKDKNPAYRRLIKLLRHADNSTNNKQKNNKI